MWGAIIQAIDHALGRMNEGAGAGIKVAKSQSGGGAPISNSADGSAGDAAKVAQDLRNQDTPTSEQEEAAEASKIGSNATATGEVPSSANQSKGGAGALGNIGSVGNIGDIGGGAGAEGAGEAAGEAASSEGAAEAASSIVSDENAKSSKKLSDTKDKADKTDKADKLDKFEAARTYAANLGKGFANAGTVAQGGAAKWEDIEIGKAKEAAENTLKNWREQRNKEDAATTAAKGTQNE
jgi:hypothetical protein